MQCGSVRHQGLCNAKDPICAATDLGSVGYADAGHLQTLETLIDVLLGGDVQMSRALIQKEDSRPSIECSREHYALFLPA